MAVLKRLRRVENVSLRSPSYVSRAYQGTNEGELGSAGCITLGSNPHVGCRAGLDQTQGCSVGGKTRIHVRAQVIGNFFQHSLRISQFPKLTAETGIHEDASSVRHPRC